MGRPRTPFDQVEIIFDNLRSVTKEALDFRIVLGLSYHLITFSARHIEDPRVVMISAAAYCFCIVNTLKSTNLRLKLINLLTDHVNLDRWVVMHGIRILTELELQARL